MKLRKEDAMHIKSAALWIAACLATGCSPAQPPKQDAPMNTTTNKDPITKEDWHRAMTTDDFGNAPVLVDVERGIYRFVGGACRDLNNTVSPWVPVEEDGRKVINHLGVAYQADTAAFGIPVPPGPLDPIDDRRKLLVDVGFSSPHLEDWREKIVREALTRPDRELQAASYETDFSVSFRAVATQFPDSKAIIDRNLMAGVYCEDGQSRLPNPACQGLVMIDEHESAKFTITLAGLTKLEDVVRSIRSLSAAIRTECPIKD
jgi:hypothetical protein